jgi:hypothetical protein
VQDFYEIEAIRNGWSVRQLERQIASSLFQRLSKSRDKKGVLALASNGQVLSRPQDAINDPYVLDRRPARVAPAGRVARRRGPDLLDAGVPSGVG